MNNNKISVLRDTGCSIIGVRESLVREDQKLKSLYTLKLVDGQVNKYPMAQIDINTPFLKGIYFAAMFKDPVADLIIGNVDEAKSVEYANAVTRAKEKQLLSTEDKTEESGIIDLKGWGKGCDGFREDQINDESLKHLWDRARLGSADTKKTGLVYFVEKNGLLYKTFESDVFPESVIEQLVIPMNRRNLVLETAHTSSFAGHMSINKTRDRVYSIFFWPGVDRDIKQFVRSCRVCQMARAPGNSGKAELGVMNIITTPFMKVAIDIIGPLQLTDRRNRYILTMVDVATRWPDAAVLSNIHTNTIIEALCNMFSRIGFPEQILSDNGPQFKSELYEQVCRFFQIKCIKTTPYHPSSNGMVERFNGTLKNMLRKLAEKEPKNWDRFVNAALFAYREIPNETTGFSPYEMIYGRRVRGPMSILKNIFTNQFIEQETKDIYEYIFDLKNRLSIVSQLAQQNDKLNRNNYKK